MREHIYKAKRVDNGEWVEGYYVSKKAYCTSPHAPIWYDKHFICVPVRSETYEYFKDIEIDPETLSQYTGLKDSFIEILKAHIYEDYEEQIFVKPLSYENYTEACRLIKKLFMGEE